LATADTTADNDFWMDGKTAANLALIHDQIAQDAREPLLDAIPPSVAATPPPAES